METTVFTSKFSNLDAIGDFYTAAAEEAGLDEKSTYEVQLAVDEAAANIIEHAYGGEDIGEIKCSYEIQPEKLVIVIKDYGKPFEPDLVEEPDLKADPCCRKTRGLGLLFMRSLMDSLDFSFNGGGGNVLTMIKNRAKTKNLS